MVIKWLTFVWICMIGKFTSILWPLPTVMQCFANWWALNSNNWFLQPTSWTTFRVSHYLEQTVPTNTASCIVLMHGYFQSEPLSPTAHRWLLGDLTTIMWPRQLSCDITVWTNHRGLNVANCLPLDNNSPVSRLMWTWHGVTSQNGMNSRRNPHRKLFPNVSFIEWHTLIKKKMYLEHRDASLLNLLINLIRLNMFAVLSLRLKAADCGCPERWR